MKILALLAIALPLFGADPYLFTSFRGNGETGVFFALSQDGKKWVPANGDKASVKFDVPGMLMRDPWIGKGPDGTWHMLWTWGWTREPGGQLRIGHSTSKDLVDWTPPQAIEVMADQSDARNAWAPEATWDDARKEWVIFWATTIGTGKAYDHRIYATRTKDWTGFTKSEKFFDPGYSSIDSTVVKDGDRWIMVFKDEREPPVGKRLRLAFAKSPQGPWSEVTEPFSGDWVEGPTVLQNKAEWLIYFDHYAKPQHYGAMITTDWKTFRDITNEVSFPAGQRHGTVVQIPAALAQKLTPHFEVVSVKPSSPGFSGSSGILTRKGFLNANECTLQRYIMGAWGVGQNQISGGPDWLNTDRYDIVARADRPVGDDAVMMEMLQGVLADRFKLAIHQETRNMQAYVLAVGKNGPKLEKSAGGEASTTSGRGRIEAKAANLNDFAAKLGRMMDLPVVNGTGLDGIYDIKLEWSPDDSKPELGPSIFTAIQDLGLRLTTQKMPIELLVIDHAEKPSEN